MKSVLQRVRIAFWLLLMTAVVSGHAASQLRLESETGASNPEQLMRGVGGGGSAGESKSILLAVGASLILPGLGELYAGNFETGRYFMAADGALWLAYGGAVSRGNWIREDARTFATQNSGALFAGKDEQFEVNVGNFMNTKEYNEAKLRNRELSLVYRSAEYSWEWQSDDDRQRFRSLRIASDEWKQASRFVVGALVVNRLVSAFSAGRAASRRNQAQSAGWEIQALPFGDGFTGSPGVTLQVRTSF